jgi:hypothetical protein
MSAVIIINTLGVMHSTDEPSFDCIRKSADQLANLSKSEMLNRVFNALFEGTVARNLAGVHQEVQSASLSAIHLRNYTYDKVNKCLGVDHRGKVSKPGPESTGSQKFVPCTLTAELPKSSYHAINVGELHSDMIDANTEVMLGVPPQADTTERASMLVNMNDTASMITCNTSTTASSLRTFRALAKSIAKSVREVRSATSSKEIPWGDVRKLVAAQFGSDLSLEQSFSTLSITSRSSSTMSLDCGPSIVADT